MKRFTAIFALVTATFALLAPESMLGMGIHDCCALTAKQPAKSVAGHGAHCAHMAMRSAPSTPISIHMSMQGCCKCCLSVTNADTGMVAASSRVSAAIHTQTIASPELFPVFYAARISGERAPPSI